MRWKQVYEKLVSVRMQQCMRQSVEYSSSGLRGKDVFWTNPWLVDQVDAIGRYCYEMFFKRNNNNLVCGVVGTLRQDQSSNSFWSFYWSFTVSPQLLACSWLAKSSKHSDQNHQTFILSRRKLLFYFSNNRSYTGLIACASEKFRKNSVLVFLKYSLIFLEDTQRRKIT